jgi:hypothetical protein
MRNSQGREAPRRGRFQKALFVAISGEQRILSHDDHYPTRSRRKQMKADKVSRNSMREWLSHWGDGSNWSDPTGATVPTAKTTIRDLLDDADAMETALREIRSRLNMPGDPGSVAMQIHRLIDNALATTSANCRGCAAPLSSFNFDKIADGCPCNSGRGVNHGLVPKNTCTCVECDPAQTGSVRRE